MERLLDDVRRLGIPHGPSSPDACVPVSIGAATTVPVVGSAPADLVAAADRMLHRMKEAGRDRGTLLVIDRDELVDVRM